MRPFLVYLVTKLGGNALVYGVMGAIFFFQLLGVPALVRWSDRYGRRYVPLLSQAGTPRVMGISLAALWRPIRQALSKRVPLHWQNIQSN